MNFDFDRVVIFTPSFEQRVSKQAYSFVKRGLFTTVYAETAEVSKEFENYICDVNYVEIPVIDKIKRTPLGIGRKKLIKKALSKAFSEGGRTLIVSRDVNYGYIVGRTLQSFDKDKYYYITDIADNYDLFYGSFSNVLKRGIFKVGFGFLTRRSYQYSDAVYIVASINRERILQAFPNELKGKKILLLRNLPMHIEYIQNPRKVPNSMVYVGKIDEISRDPFYVLEKLKEMPDFSLHLFSEQKKATIKKMKVYISEHGLRDRVVFHQRVKYDELAQTISKYQIGLVPHKRGLITDYTIPNKIYDYKRSGIITVMSDCPSLIDENNTFQFGMVYSKEKDSFVETVKKALNYKLDFNVCIPEWDEEFEKTFNEIKTL